MAVVTPRGERVFRWMPDNRDIFKGFYEMGYDVYMPDENGHKMTWEEIENWQPEPPITHSVVWKPTRRQEDGES